MAGMATQENIVDLKRVLEGKADNPQVEEMRNIVERTVRLCDKANNSITDLKVSIESLE